MPATASTVANSSASSGEIFPVATGRLRVRAMTVSIF